MSDPNKLVGRLVKIAGKMGVITHSEYLEEHDIISVSIVLHDGENFISHWPQISYFLI
tara:strand:- start:305 stop:478 length:174 start_codon:yes stop_codon:yes gene_type:complete